MDSNPSAILKVVLPLTPLILKTAVLNVLSLSKNSSKQSARVEVIIAVIRELINRKAPVSRSQKLSLKDPGIKGPIWIAKASIQAPPELDVHDALLAAIKELGNGTEVFSPPEYATISGEWTGWRAKVSKNESRPSFSESEQYNSLMKEVSSPVTILYFHGGAFFVMDPASHRKVTSYLAKSTNGRVFSLRYRLAPQDPFPSALLDALLSYLYLLSPPAGSFHDPIPASNIIFSGDSAGGNLALTLNLLILTLNRVGITSLPYHGKLVPLTPPAGVAGNSPWCDISSALPSLSTNAHYDYIFPPNPDGTPQLPDPPSDHLWPTSPPRAELYCSATLLTHPLVSPITATPSMWQSSPPIFICVGEEALTDGCEITARHMHEGGARLVFAGYEGMPHCFAMVFPTTPMGKDCFHRWSQFCISAASSPTTNGTATATATSTPTSTAVWLKARTNPPLARSIALDKLTAIDDGKLKEFMDVAVSRATKREEEAMREWEGEKAKAKL